MESAKKINVTMRIFTALAVIFVVGGHIMEGSFGFLLFDYFPAYQYHLPMFLAVSGYFYNKKSALNFSGYVWKKIKHLLIPLYLWNLVYGLFHAAVFPEMALAEAGGVQSLNLNSLLLMPLWNGHQFALNLCTWFVPPLFFAEIINAGLHRLGQRLPAVKEIWFVVLYLVIGTLGFGMAKYGYAVRPAPLLLVKTVTFLGFLALGMAYREYGEKHDTLPSGLYFAVVLSVQLVLLYFVQIKMHLSLGVNLSWMHDIELVGFQFFTALVGMAFWLRISKILTPLCQDQHNILQRIGADAYAIMVHQFLGLMLVKTIFLVGFKYFQMFDKFDVYKYSHDIYYFYCPGGLSQFYIVYLAAGLFIPLLVAHFLRKSNGLSKYLLGS